MLKCLKSERLARRQKNFEESKEKKRRVQEQAVSKTE